MIRGFASYHVNVAITVPACAFIYSVTGSRLSYVQQSTLYCIYVMFMHANHVVPCTFRPFAYLARAQLGKYRGCFGFSQWRFKSSHWHIRTPPDLHPRHVCPPCRSPAHRSIFSRSFPALISRLIPCTRPYIFFLFCGQPCFLLRICATLRRRYQCVLILPMGTLPFLFFSDKTACARSQPTVSCPRRLQRSWRTRRKLLSRANQSLSRSSRTLVFGRYVFPFFFA